MVQNGSWQWLLEGFKIDLETQVKRRTVKDYCDHVSYFARWAQGSDRKNPGCITKRDIQDFLHFVASTPAIFTTGSGAKRQVQRDQNSRWHHYFPLKRFFIDTPLDTRQFAGERKAALYITRRVKVSLPATGEYVTGSAKVIIPGEEMYIQP